jgi:transposase-like protein
MPAGISIPKKRGKAKEKLSSKRRALKERLQKWEVEDLDVSLSLIQELIPVALKAVEDKLTEEVNKITGIRYEHGKDNVRWGRQGGSIYLRDQKIPIEVPRVRNKEGHKEVSLETYKRLQQPYLSDEQTILKLLHGISMRNYKKCAELIPEVFGISPSNLSRRFKNRTSALVRELQSRSLSRYDFICIFVDGKRYAKDGLLIALGVTIEGKKIILGIEQSSTENALVADQFFDKLIERGLRFEEGLLFIVDGSKGLIKNIKAKFQEYAFIQRCLWHKKQNVISYLNQSQQEICKRRMQMAYQKTNYKEAREALNLLHNELCRVNQSAADSLTEGLDETLTLHKLGLAPELCKSLNSTNCIESVMSCLSQYTNKVDRWHNSYQLLRWTAASLLQVEPYLQRVKGFRYLKVLRFKMQEEIKERQDIKYGRKFQESLEPIVI